MEKTYYIFAGTNGVGKSTLYSLNRVPNEVKELPLINADNILRSFKGDWNNSEDQFKSGRMAVKEKNKLLKEGKSFCQETTLTGSGIVNSLKKIKDMGYNIKMYYVGLDNADLSIERVRNRVKSGGHGIEEDVIRRRYNKSLENLNKVINLCDSIIIYDNTYEFKKLAEIDNGKLLYYSNQQNVSWLDKTFKKECENSKNRKIKNRDLENEYKR